MKCIDAFKNIYIEVDSDSTRISSCCLMPTKTVDSINFKEDHYLQDIRKVWNTDTFPKQCFGCKKREDKNLPSRRIGSNQWYFDNNLRNYDVELIKIDYWVGDLCNLSCAICGPKFSSKWKEELKIPIIERKVKINKQWENINLEKIKLIHFNGGEPLLSKEHIRFLDKIPNKNLVELDYNTNGTILPSEKLVKLWEQFKLVQLDFSIDDIKERFEYQRYPSSWNTIDENLKWFLKETPVNMMFNINCSIGILNHLYIDELKQWHIDNFSENRLGDPVEFRTQFVNGILSLEDYENKKEKIVSYLDSLDQRRKTDWRKTFPEVSNLLENCS